jgi:hypothetical protein
VPSLLILGQKWSKVGALGFAAQPNLQSHLFTKAGTNNVTVTVTDPGINDHSPTDKLSTLNSPKLNLLAKGCGLNGIGNLSG